MTRRLATLDARDKADVAAAVARVRACVDADGVVVTAGRIGIHPDTVRNWLRDEKPTTPTPFIARAVVRALNNPKETRRV